MGSFITFPQLLIFIPLLAGLISFWSGKQVAKNVAMLASILVFGISLFSFVYADVRDYNYVSYHWLDYLGTSFFVGLDDTGRILTLLTATVYPLILASTLSDNYKNASSFYGLMMLTQAGLMGVFCAFDALVFYFFWELALIPVYFLCSMWGGERRIQATFKFFVYTFTGSLLMLIGIIYVYLHTPLRVFENGVQAAHSFNYSAFKSAMLSSGEQSWLFWLFFVAFAIKMPVFPFHTWQPDTYDKSPTSVTAVLSGIMVKMGLFGVIRWLLPLFPAAVSKFTPVVMWMSIIGILYASLIAIRQDNLKKLVAYSSIAHIGLMCAALFSMKEIGAQGVLLQMLSHGINVVGLWIVIDIIERKTGTKKISELGGLAIKAPSLTILLVVIALANIALPLTNAFIGEFLMFAGVWQHNPWMASTAALSVILAAVYTLNMVQKVFYGKQVASTENVKDISFQEKVILAILVVFILVMGVYPQPIIDFTKDAATLIAGISK